MRIEIITDKFEIDVGAPRPTILSNEHKLFLIFYGQSVTNLDKSIKKEKINNIVTIRFDDFVQFKFGNTNDEAISGHPLYELGLQPYAVQKIIDSEWVQKLVKMNSVHPHHKDEHFQNYEHYIFFFHDTCFEIVTEGYAIEVNSESIMKNEISRIGLLL